MRTEYAKLLLLAAFQLFVFSTTKAADDQCYTKISEDPYHTHTIPTYKCESDVRPTRVRTPIKKINFKPQPDKNYHGKSKVDERLAQTQRASTAEQNPDYWKNKDQETLTESIKAQKFNRNVAKNVILFLGDGMGIQTVAAGRILKGQELGQGDANYRLAMEMLPHAGLSKTYNVDHQVPDSAGTGTAYLTGVKTRYGVLGLNAKTVYKDCSSAKGNEVNSVLKDFHNEGKATGIVTTTRLVHATPAASYAHSASRYWYDDTDLSSEAKENRCKDIAYQLYENLPNIEVALGGGRRYFRPYDISDEEYPDKYYARRDGQDLIEKWKMNMDAMKRKKSFVWNKSQLNNVNVEETDHLWGMFEQSDMQFDADRDQQAEPSIKEMTVKAIEMLQKNENGFFLLVEGGRIDRENESNTTCHFYIHDYTAYDDHAHHDGNAYRALYDTVAFDDAIEAARNMTSGSDTLIIVTADHGHTFNMGGYGTRNNPIFGLAPSNEDPETALDLKPYTVLSYGNGPGFQGKDIDYDEFRRESPLIAEIGEKDYLQQTAVPLSSESHGGDDVLIIASGPMAHLVNGVHEQNYIAHVMRYAACVGDNKDHCENQAQTTEENNVVIVKTEFLGYQLSRGEAESALNALFSLEIIFSVFMLALCFLHVSKR